MFFSANLKFLRNRAGKRQIDIAILLSTKQSTYAAWEEERSQPPYSTLIAISELYQVTINDLVKTDLSKLSQQQTTEHYIISRYNLASPNVKAAVDSILQLA